MSYNIDSTEYLGPSTLCLRGDVVLELKRTLGKQLPELNLIDAILAHTHFSADGSWAVPAEELWSSSFSGNTYDLLIEKVLPRTTGSADILFTWEGGDAHTGVRVRDGVVTRHKVVMALGGPE